MNERTKIHQLLNQAGLPNILDEMGFPHPGMVIKHYRERMTYEDTSGKIRHWTQGDLAKALGVAEVTVRHMETHNKGLDSMERRRLIATLLNIPPVLLGISAIDDVVTYLQQQHPSQTPSSKKSSFFDDALAVYWDAHYIGTPAATIPTINGWVQRIRQETKGEQQQTLLCEWFLLLANMYADNRDFGEAFLLLENALNMARANDDKELEAAILYRIGHIHLDHHTFSLAKDSLLQAYSLRTYVNGPLHGAISQTTGLAIAFTAQSEHDRASAEHYLDEAANLTDTTDHDPYYVRFNYGRYLLELGDTLIVLGRPTAALEALDEADTYVGSDQLRRKGYISILRADALTNLKKPR